MTIPIKFKIQGATRASFRGRKTSLPYMGGAGGGGAVDPGGGVTPSGISVVETFSGTVPASGSTIVTFSEVHEENDLIAVAWAGDNGPAAIPTGFTSLASANFIYAARGLQGATPSVSITIPGASRISAFIGVVLRGVDASVPEDVTVQTSVSSGSTASLPSITPITDGAFIWGIGNLHNDTATINSYPANLPDNRIFSFADGSFTQDTSLAVATVLQDTAATLSPGNFVFSSSDANNGIVVAFRPAG